MHARFYKRGRTIDYYKASTIWACISDAIHRLLLDTTWNIGSNSKQAGGLLDIFPIPSELPFTRNTTIGELILEGMLSLPQQMKVLLDKMTRSYGRGQNQENYR